VGRSRRRQQDERDAALFALGREAGRREGRREGFLKVLTRIAKRLLLADARDAARVVEQQGPQRALDAIRRLSAEVWRGRWQEALSETLEAIMDEAPLRTDRGPVRLGFDVRNPELGEFFDSYRLRLATQVTDTTRSDLEGIIRKAMDEGLSVPDTARLIREKGEEFSKSRAETIARTELHRAALSAAEIQARRSGVVSGRVWRATNDARTRAEHRRLDGTRVGLEEPFPGDLHPATEVNCRCYLEFVVNTEALGPSVDTEGLG
jgi:SPP1 gp7 family putative phage head morphogenesis protein